MECSFRFLHTPLLSSPRSSQSIQAFHSVRVCYSKDTPSFPSSCCKAARRMGYADAQAGALSRTAFRSAEKKYKRYTHLSSAKSRNQRSRRAQVPATDVSEVLDFRVDGDGSFAVAGVSRVEGYDWPVYKIDKRPGFFFIPEALTEVEQLHWAAQCLATFPQPPNQTNHNAMYGPIVNLWAAFQKNQVLVEIDSGEQGCDSVVNLIGTDSSSRSQRVGEEGSEEEMAAERNRFREDGATTSGVAGGKRWRFCGSSEDELGRPLRSVPAETLVRKLRWATLGVQFDWAKRAYNEALPFQEISPKLAELAARLAKPAMVDEEFKAEAAIVNFYGPDDMLGGHIDDMEADMSKPIRCILKSLVHCKTSNLHTRIAGTESLGCKAVFLLGGSTRDELPLAMFVRSGDVVLMAGSARHCFHGVPRIFSDEKESELPDFTSAPDVDGVQISPILNYLKNSRINVNIRQVH